MSKLQFKPEQIAFYQNFVEGTIVVSKASKEIFKAEYEMFKANKANPLKVTALSRRTIMELTDDANMIARVKKISKLAHDYTRFTVIANFDDLYFYNIEKIVQTFDLLEKNEKTALIKTFREDIKSLHSKDLTQTAYNNLVKDFIAEFMKDNGMKDVDGEFVFTDAFGVITALLAQMDIIQLQKIAEAVAEQKKHPLSDKVEAEAETPDTTEVAA